MKQILLILALCALFFTTQASQCSDKVTASRKKFNDASPAQQAILMGKVSQLLYKKHPNSNKPLIAWFLGNILFNTKHTPEKVCKAYDNLFSVNGLAKNDLWDCLVTCLREKFTYAQILRIVGNCISADNVPACIVSAAGDEVFKCVSACPFAALIKKKDEPTECEVKVLEAREKYSRLDRRGRDAMKVVLKRRIFEKHPNAPRNVVTFFVEEVMFNSNTYDAKNVCMLYETLFGVKGLASKPWYQCTFDCLVGKLPPQEIFRIVSACAGKDDILQCIGKEVGGPLFNCIADCIEPTKKDDQCPVKVKEARVELRGIKKPIEFIKFLTGIQKKIKEKHPEAEVRTVNAFIYKYLFNVIVKPEAVCEKYAELFLSSSTKAQPKKEECPCVKKVLELREYWKSIKTRKEKLEYLVKVFKGLKGKFPNAKDSKIKNLIGFLFIEGRNGFVEPVEVCKKYKELSK